MANLDDLNIYETIELAQYDENQLPNYEYPPKISRSTWDKLGDIVSSLEKTGQNAGGSDCITLRFDLHGFSKATKKLRQQNVFTSGYDEHFEKFMQKTTVGLMDEFNAVYGFTQSDEITIIIKPTSVDQKTGLNYPHNYSGRCQKLTTLGASFATQSFVRQLDDLCLEKNLPRSDVCVMFDCRMSCTKTMEDAFRLILWRAYDCGVNGVTSGVLFSGVDGHKKMVGANTWDKLKWLAENNLLPLRPHQAHGSFYYKNKRLTTGFNPITQSVVDNVYRDCIDKLDGCVINNVKNHTIMF